MRCRDCPLHELSKARTGSEAGRLLERVLELDFVAERFKVGWDEVTAEEVNGLQILKQERDRWSEELRQRQSNQG